MDSIERHKRMDGCRAAKMASIQKKHLARVGIAECFLNNKISN